MLRRAAIVLLAAAATGCAGGGGPDEAAYQDYVVTYIGDYYDSRTPDAGPADRRWVTAHADLVLAEGNAACAWLRTQPKAPRTRTNTGPYSLTEVLARYGESPTTTPLSAGGRSTIAAGAWEHLCRSERSERTSPTAED
jgi:hypothetical protein